VPMHDHYSHLNSIWTFPLNLHINRLGHYTIPEEMDEVCAWLTSKLGLEGNIA